MWSWGLFTSAVGREGEVAGVEREALAERVEHERAAVGVLVRLRGTSDTGPVAAELRRRVVLAEHERPSRRRSDQSDRSIAVPPST